MSVKLATGIQIALPAKLARPGISIPFKVIIIATIILSPHKCTHMHKKRSYHLLQKRPEGGPSPPPPFIKKIQSAISTFFTQVVYYFPQTKVPQVASFLIIHHRSKYQTQNSRVSTAAAATGCWSRVCFFFRLSHIFG